MRHQHGQGSRTCYPTEGAETSPTTHTPYPRHLAQRVANPTYSPSQTSFLFRGLSTAISNFHLHNEDSIYIYSFLTFLLLLCVCFHHCNHEIMFICTASTSSPWFVYLCFFYLGVGILFVDHTLPSPTSTPSRFTSSFFVFFLSFTGSVDLVYFGTS